MFSLIIAILSIALIVAVVALSGYFGGDAISDAQAKAQAAQLINEQVQIFSAMDGFQADNRRWPSDIQELVTSGYLRSIPAGVQVQTTAAASFELISSAHAADPLALGWSMPAARVPIIFTVKVPKTTCQAYNQVSRGDNGILRQAFESLAAQCYGADGNYNVVAKKAVAGVNLSGVLPTSVEPGNLPAKEMDDWWDSVPDGAVQVPTDPDKTPKAALAVTGAGLNFGQVQLGQAVTSPTITLRNGGKVMAQGVNITAPMGFDLVDNTCEAQLGAGASCSFAIGFAPAAVESYAGAVTASASNGSSVQLPTSGSGVRGSASFTGVSFGDVPAGQQVQGDAVLTNTGVGALRLGGATVTGEGFSVTQNNCGATLAAGASCSIKVALTAAGVTSHIGVLTVPSAEMGNLLADLAGQSREARLSVLPATAAFGDVLIGMSKVSAAHTVRNTGNLSIANLAITRPEDTNLANNTCGAALAVGATCTFDLQFTPTQEKTYSSPVSITGDSAVAQVTVSGKGVKASATLSAVDFGAMAAGASKELTSTLTNTGVGAVVMVKPSAVSVTGAGFSFVSTTCVETLPVAGSCSITVRFSSTTGSGAMAGQLSVSSPGYLGTKTATLSATMADNIVYSIGAAGIGTTGVGGDGGATTVTFKGVTLTGFGGNGAGRQTTSGAAGGDFSVTGSGSTGMRGGWGSDAESDWVSDEQYYYAAGGGGAIGVGLVPTKTGSPSGEYPNDVSGLEFAVTSAGLSWGQPGSAGGRQVTNRHAKGFGSSGASGFSGPAYNYTGAGGNALYGGGGGGAFASGSGGNGGSGAVLVLFKDGTAVALLSGSSTYAIPSGKVVAKIWAVGAGGAGGGYTLGTGGGGAGGVAYSTF